MAVADSSRPRVIVDGKFFRLGQKKFFVKGIAYGPFKPNAQGLPFAVPELTALDLNHIRELGANVVRVYHVPPRWFLDLALTRDLRVFVDIPWNKHLGLDSEARREDARDAVRRAVAACAHHPAIFAYSVANEIPPDLVRWQGAAAMADFIDELVAAAKGVDPDCLCTYSNFPPTEFLQPRSLDFVCFNVYLHQETPFKNYLARLQMMADSKPLVLGEFGVDSLREGEAHKCEMLAWQIENAFRGGLAGAVVFTYTDDWYRDGRFVEDWKMGLVTKERSPKESFGVVQKMFRAAPYFPIGAPVTDPACSGDATKRAGLETGAPLPKVSIVVASYNGAATLKACLDSLQQLNYPDYEIILVDDGSTDTTLQIAAQFADGSKGDRNLTPSTPSPRPTGERAGVRGTELETKSENLLTPTLSSLGGGEGGKNTQLINHSADKPSFHYFRHEKNLGLSVARNTGIAAATGEIIAFTDADCRADEDWLHYLVGDLLDSKFVGIGGPNLLPPEDSPVAAAVMASPGGPAHVMLTDREAEHIPGCNMAFYKWALDGIGGFDPIFMKAGDDVDLCWRLQQAGHKIGFSPSAFVWHYRRSTVVAYLKQQQGYGEAEALLVRKHPKNFNTFGGGLWRGRIYASAKFGVEVRRSVIYHGLFGSAGFQKLYAAEPATTLMLCTTLEYHLFIVLPLLVLSAVLHYLAPVAIASLLIPICLCAAAGVQAALPKNKREWWSRPLVALLFFLQPIVRGWARHQGRLTLQPLTLAAQQSLDSVALQHGRQSLDEVQYWAAARMERVTFVTLILQRLAQKNWPHRADIGWSAFDVEIFGSRWSHLQLTTVAEDHAQQRQLIRCRLRAVFSLTAQIALATLLGSELLLIGLLPAWRPWSWLVLLTLSLGVWLILRDQRKLQSIATVLLDALAKEHGLAKIRPENPGDRPDGRCEDVRREV